MKVRTHWTISALKDYETCPAKYRWSYLFDASDWLAIGYKVVPDKGSPAMQRGTDVHATCEQYLLGTIAMDGLHKDIRQSWRTLLDGLKLKGAKPEVQWEVDAGWNPRMPGDDLWLRAKIDAHYVAGDRMVLIDFKTGKPYTANREQMEVYALLGFAMHDDVGTIQTELWYFDHDATDEKTFRREDAPKLARKWEQRAGRLLDAKDYPPRPNRLCGWCPYNLSKGGPCAAGK